MIDVAKVLRQGLRQDPVVQTIAGTDSSGEYKVYTSLAPANTPAPYVTVSVVPTGDVVGAYGDPYVLEAVPLMVKAWGVSPQQAWELAQAVEEAMAHIDVATDPYNTIRLVRTLPPQEMGDRDTNYTQVMVHYEVDFAR